MNNYQRSEIKGRKKLESWLTYYKFKNLSETKDAFDRVDFFATSKRDRNYVFEIKDRNLINKYTNKVYDSILLETDKVNAVIQRKKDEKLDCAFYACFSNNELYLFNLERCPSWHHLALLPKTTAGESNEKVWKDATYFLIENAWHFIKDEANNWKLINKPLYYANHKKAN